MGLQTENGEKGQRTKGIDKSGCWPSTEPGLGVCGSGRTGSDLGIPLTPGHRGGEGILLGSDSLHRARPAGA